MCQKFQNFIETALDPCLKLGWNCSQRNKTIDLYIFSGEYSCLKVRLVFKREFSYYLLTIYVPSCMLVIVSWVSFWLDSKSVPARVSLGVTTLLTMSTQTAGVNRSLPPVAYTKGLSMSFYPHLISNLSWFFSDINIWIKCGLSEFLKKVKVKLG